jgi:broad specificity phosphatase PhoE
MNTNWLVVDPLAHPHHTALLRLFLSGESCMDVTLRLEPPAQEMERTREPVLIVAHQGILRILHACLMGLDRKEAPHLLIPLNNVIELTPHAHGCHEKGHYLMMKEEMLNDGQDEPITSMPRSSKES